MDLLAVGQQGNNGREGDSASHLRPDFFLITSQSETFPLFQIQESTASKNPTRR
jgi:hypothetical protein